MLFRSNKFNMKFKKNWADIGNFFRYFYFFKSPNLLSLSMIFESKYCKQKWTKEYFFQKRAISGLFIFIFVFWIRQFSTTLCTLFDKTT